MKLENKAENQKQTSLQPKLSESAMLAHEDMVELSDEELTAGGVIGGAAADKDDSFDVEVNEPVFQSRVRLDFQTSFTGNDLLGRG